MSVTTGLEAGRSRRPTPRSYRLAALVMTGAWAFGRAWAAEPAPKTAPESAAAESATAAGVPVTPRLLVEADALVLHHGPDAPALEDGAVRPGFSLRRVRLGADAADGFWRGRVIWEAVAGNEVARGGGPVGSVPPAGGAINGPPLDPIAGALAGGAPRVTEAFVAFVPHAALALAAGALRVPLGLSRQIAEADLRLPERARIITRATPDFRVGVAASGDLGIMQYAFGSYAAAATAATSSSSFTDGGVLTVLRLSAEPVGPVGLAPQWRRRDDPWSDWWRFAVGLSAFHAALPGANELGLGGDGQFQWRRLCVAGEVLWTRRSGADRAGFYVEPGVFLWPDRLELVARGEWLNDEVGPRSAADGWGASLGLGVYPGPRHARVQAAYTIRRPLAGDTRSIGWALLRATFAL